MTSVMEMCILTVGGTGGKEPRDIEVRNEKPGKVPHWKFKLRLEEELDVFLAFK